MHKTFMYIHDYNVLFTVWPQGSTKEPMQQTTK